METGQKNRFYVVSMRKFTLLMLGTGGMYAVYWFFKMFTTMGARTNRELLPIVRCLLPFLFVFGLYSFIYKEEQKRENPKHWNPDNLAWVIIFCWVVEMLLLGFRDSIAPLVFFAIDKLVLVVQFYSMYQVQLSVNRIEGDPFGRENEKINTTNVLWIAFGLFYLVNSLLSAYLIQTGQIEPPTAIVQPAKETPSPPQL